MARKTRPAYDSARLDLLERVFESTWSIFQARYPFRDLNNDRYYRAELGRKLFILASCSGLTKLDQLQKSVLESATFFEDRME
jgi:hypothetical protein